MKKRLTWAISATLTAAAFSAAADGSAILDGGWRLSVGPVYNFNAEASCRVAPRQGYVSPFRAGLSRAEAERKAGGTRKGTRIEFANGAWIDTDDPVCEEGDLPGMTRFYKFPRTTWNGEKSFALGSADYSEVSLNVPTEGLFDRSFGDDSGMLGVNIELSRNLYHDEEHGWGVDAAVAFQYFKHNGLLGVASKWFNGSSTHRYGTRSMGLNLADEMKGTYSDYNWSGDGSYYGSGGEKVGPGRYVDEFGEDVNAGPILPELDNMGGSDYSASDASYGSMRADGDYENMEILLLARPYYDVTEWFRINATIGLVVSRQDLDFEMSILRDGAVEYSSNRDFSQWDVYGVGGLGLMLYYKDFTLSADFLARFLDNDLDFKDRYIAGEVSRGTWMFKLALGYEF